nr:hypothetical protein [Tanacetum cinerariifolium]
MTSLTDKAILSGADNRPPMLEKDMYDSWKTEAIQADCDVKETNIILQGIPPEVNTKFLNILPPEWRPSSSNLSISYLVNDISSTVNHNAYMASSSAPQIDYALMVHHSSEFSSHETRLVVPDFQKGDDPINAINHMMSFLTAVVTLRYLATNNKLKTSSNPRQQETINNGRVTIQPIQGRQNSMSAGSGGASGKQKDCDELNYAKIALMANLSHYGSDNLAETESSAEQTFWSQYSVPTDEPNLSGTIIVEVPKELPKVSMVDVALLVPKLR